MYFSNFSISILFLFQDLIQLTTLPLLVFMCQFINLGFFYNFDSSEEYWLIIQYTVPHLGLSDVFLMLRLVLQWGFRKEYHKNLGRLPYNIVSGVHELHLPPSGSGTLHHQVIKVLFTDCFSLTLL